MTRRPTVLMCCWGSLGELHPLLAVARALVARGVDVHIACDEQFKRYLAIFGVGWAALEPPLYPAGLSRDQYVARLFDRRGLRHLIARLDGHVEEQALSVRRAVAAIGGCDLLAGSWLTPGAAIAAERDGIPWAHLHLYPFSLMHPADLPVLPETGGEGPRFPEARYRHYFERQFARTLALRRAWGLAPLPGGPSRASAAACAEIALFPEWLMRAPAASPAALTDRAVAFAGFPEPIRFPGSLGPRIVEFLRDGTPPLLVTLGSALPAVAAARHAAIVAACRRLGRRAVIVDGSAAADEIGRDVATLRFVSPVVLMPHCAAGVNHGGINSVGEALRFGKPLLAIPHAFDQFDNAARVEWLGAGRGLPASAANEATLAACLGDLLDSAGIAAAAASAAGRIGAHDGSADAAAALAAQLPLAAAVAARA